MLTPSSAWGIAPLTKSDPSQTLESPAGREPWPTVVGWSPSQTGRCWDWRRQLPGPLLKPQSDGFCVGARNWPWSSKVATAMGGGKLRDGHRRAGEPGGAEQHRHRWTRRDSLRYVDVDLVQASRPRPLPPTLVHTVDTITATIGGQPAQVQAPYSPVHRRHPALHRSIAPVSAR
jgi:hypothetical protein